MGREAVGPKSMGEGKAHEVFRMATTVAKGAMAVIVALLHNCTLLSEKACPAVSCRTGLWNLICLIS